MLNTVALMGRLVADPELKQTPNGVSVVSFRIAVDRNFTTQGGTRETDFINIVAWRGTAEFVGKYFQKGSMAVITGAIQMRNYTDRDNNKRTAFEVVANSVLFGESKNTAQSDSKESAAPVSSYASGDFSGVYGDSDDLPF